MTLPCKSCPWRAENTADIIPGYSQKKAERLRNTVGDEDGFRPIMACHASTEDKPISCKGYLAREGWRNLNVRMLLARGKIESPGDVLEACEREGIELEPDYETVLEKLSS